LMPACLTRLDGMGRSPDALIVHPEQPRDSRQKRTFAPRAPMHKITVSGGSSVGP
jgi:hypothetical protein